MSDADLEAIYHYRRLSERLATGGQPRADQLTSLAQAGFEVVINLAMPDSPYALTDEKSRVESLGLTYVAIPVVFEKPTRADFDKFCQTLEQYQDKKLFVHCIANMRVSAFIALHRILKEGWTLVDAWPDVHAIWEPDAVWQVFMQDVLQTPVTA